MTSFAYQVLWTRALVFYLGNSTYAFTIILTTVLVGIAIGGYLVRFFVDRLKDPLRCFAWVQVGIGLSAVAAMPLLNIIISSTGFFFVVRVHGSSLGNDRWPAVCDFLHPHAGPHDSG
ncbi:MAG: hypothetical protein ACKVI3_17485, partial [Verrucomicrobiia bacterium]